MEISPEKQIKRTIIEECIRVIDNKIEQCENSSAAVSQLYINGLIKAANIIKKMKRERYL